MQTKLSFANNKVVAHRGAWKKNSLPENSIASLKEAIQLGCTGSEFDVWMTADDSLVIHHDPDFNNLVIEKTNYAALEVFTLSNGEKLPTLREYLLAGMKNNNSTRLVCEIKPSKISAERGKEVAAKVMNLVHDLKAKPWIVFISFDYGIVEKLNELDPQIPTQYLNGDKSPEELKAGGIDGLDYHFSVFKKHPEWIESAKKNQLVLNGWTVNDEATMDWLLANDFDFITTNEPELLLEKSKMAPTALGWKLIWSDEFNQDGLPDSSKWNYQTGGNGWGNNELQYYTEKDTNNVVIKNGILHITAIKQKTGKNLYTSARLTTKNKAGFKYGKIEARAKLPAGRGTWPAIWMLGENIDEAGWPAGGEIDIMEHVGYEKDTVRGTVHTEAYNHVKGTQKGAAVFISDPYGSFHVFSIEWTPGKIDFFMDGKMYYRFENEHKTKKEWPFDQPFYLILNLAIGGNWGGKMGVDETIFPANFQIDYVRVFQKQ
jgi:beta-glucanase (GH16 family)/glycerophosphoryl diester phosphodiesterase